MAPHRLSAGTTENAWRLSHQDSQHGSDGPKPCLAWSGRASLPLSPHVDYPIVTEVGAECQRRPPVRRSRRTRIAHDLQVLSTWDSRSRPGCQGRPERGSTGKRQLGKTKQLRTAHAASNDSGAEPLLGMNAAVDLRHTLVLGAGVPGARFPASSEVSGTTWGGTRRRPAPGVHVGIGRALPHGRRGLA